MREILLLVVLFLSGSEIQAQLADSCKLQFGTNISSLADWGTEIPFVDLMRASREWYTKSIGDPEDPFDSGFASELEYREDGYPTHIPQSISESSYPQKVVTIWAITDGWPPGEYTLLWEGEGDLEFWGSHESIEYDGSHRMIIDFPNPKGGILEMTIARSEMDDPIRNIRLLMPGTEDTHTEQPFYDLWLEKLSPFKTIRFMDWGHTNNWGQADEWDWDAEKGELVSWPKRSQLDFYTWTHPKGVPYEMMIELMNRQKLDGWICVPHVADEDYIREMARYFRDHLDPDRHLYVEYSNEIWNWMFGQAQWTNQYGAVEPGESWPEGTVKFIQRTMDIWTEEYAGQMNRLTRVVGVQAGWLDVAERVAYNMDPQSFDAVSPTYYFSFDEAAHDILDEKGSSATPADIASLVRKNMPQSIEWIAGIKTIADSLDKQLVFYEGGQHFTPFPFGEEPSYADALLQIQRSDVMYDLYQEWFELLRRLHTGDDPWLLMNFSFIGDRSARYGSWGILETMDQDVNLIPAPKYAAILDNIYEDCQILTAMDEPLPSEERVVLFPNPSEYELNIKTEKPMRYVEVIDLHGKLIFAERGNNQQTGKILLSAIPPGMYFVRIYLRDSDVPEIRKFLKI